MYKRQQTCTRDGWNVAVETVGGVPGAKLSVFKTIGYGKNLKYRWGQLEGKVYSDPKTAFDEALLYGYLTIFSDPRCSYGDITSSQCIRCEQKQCRFFDNLGI